MRGDDDQHLGFGSGLPMHGEEGPVTTLTAERLEVLPASLLSHFGMLWEEDNIDRQEKSPKRHGHMGHQSSLQSVTYSCIFSADRSQRTRV